LTRDLAHHILPKPALAPAARTNGTVNGSDIDRSNFESVTATVHFGTWTDGTHTPKMQEADDNGSGAPGAYGDVAAGDLIQSFAAVSSAPGSNTVQEVGYKGTKKWVRLVMTTSGATTGALSEGMLLLGHARVHPA
jgi:hypothetical protein